MDIKTKWPKNKIYTILVICIIIILLSILLNPIAIKELKISIYGTDYTIGTYTFSLATVDSNIEYVIKLPFTIEWNMYDFTEQVNGNIYIEHCIETHIVNETTGPIEKSLDYIKIIGSGDASYTFKAKGYKGLFDGVENNTLKSFCKLNENELVVCSFSITWEKVSPSNTNSWEGYDWNRIMGCSIGFKEDGWQSSDLNIVYWNN